MTFTARGLYAASSKEPRPRRFRWIAIGAVVAAVVLVLGVLNALGSVSFGQESRSSDFAGAETFELRNRTGGDVDVRPTAGDTLTVDRELRGTALAEARDDVSREGDAVTAVAECDGALFFGGCSVDYRIGVPEGMSVSIDATSGDVEVSSVRADVDVKLTSGEVSVEEVTGNVRAEVTSGDIQLNEIDGDMDLRTTSGDIAAEGTAETVRARATSGEIDLEEIHATSIEAKTTSGRVNVEGGFDTADLKASSGAVNVDATERFDRLVAECTSGEVDLRVPDGDYAVSGESNSGEREIGVGRDPDAASAIDATTSSGSVTISPIG